MTPSISDVISKKQELKKYSDSNRLQEEAIAYIGQPKQSISEPDKIFLRLDPLSSNGVLLEFKTDDIVFAENVEILTDNEGETFQLVKLWIRIGSIGLKLEPFSVQDYSNLLDKEMRRYPVI